MNDRVGEGGMESKPAAVIVFNEDGEIENIYCFDDHNDAVDTWQALYGKKPVVLSACQRFEQGQKPALESDIPTQPALL